MTMRTTKTVPGVPPATAAVLFILLLTALSVLSCTDDTEGVAEARIRTGMTPKAFRTLYPEAELSSYCEYRRKETLGGLSGERTFAFREKKLAWHVFNAYEEEISRENFHRFRDAAESLIDEYRLLHGEPDRKTRGITGFTDPSKSPHEGYEVLSAEWQMPDETSAIRFSFIGDRGKYAFLVTVEGKRP